MWPLVLLPPVDLLVSTSPVWRTNGYGAYYVSVIIIERGTPNCSGRTLLQYFAFHHEPHEECAVIELGPPQWGLPMQGSSYVDYCDDVRESVSFKAQSRNLPEGCEQDQGNVRHVSPSLLWYATPGIPHTRPKWSQSTPRFCTCISKIWVHKCCSCVNALRPEECRQRSTYSSPLYLLDLGDRFTLVPTYCLQERERLWVPYNRPICNYTWQRVVKPAATVAPRNILCVPSSRTFGASDLRILISICGGACHNIRHGTMRQILMKYRILRRNLTARGLWTRQKKEHEQTFKLITVWSEMNLAS